MSHFIPGKTVKTFTTKQGKEALIRYPKWEDLEEMVSFINTISQEDIYTTFAGEIITKEGEMYYLAELFKGMERGDSVCLACFINNQLVGSCSVTRDIQERKRSYHRGIFGITIGKEFRGDGIGELLAKLTIEEAKKMVYDLHLLTLNVYEPNVIAKKLYKKLGFIACGRIPKAVWYRGEYIDEEKMYKEL